MIAPRVSTWITFADGKDGVFKDIRTGGLRRRDSRVPKDLCERSKRKSLFDIPCTTTASEVQNGSLNNGMNE